MNGQLLSTIMVVNLSRRSRELNMTRIVSAIAGINQRSGDLFYLENTIENQVNVSKFHQET